jgi:transcriptional regulator with XRE-family HTH domain
MTQAELAQLLGIHDATIRQWRRGLSPTGDVVLRVSPFIDADLRNFVVPPALPRPGMRPMQPEAGGPAAGGRGLSPYLPCRAKHRPARLRRDRPG